MSLPDVPEFRKADTEKDTELLDFLDELAHNGHLFCMKGFRAGLELSYQVPGDRDDGVREPGLGHTIRVHESMSIRDALRELKRRGALAGEGKT